MTKKHWALLKVLVIVACHSKKNNNSNFLIISVQNVVWSIDVKRIAVKCHFCMICVTCVRKNLLILILGSIDKKKQYSISDFTYNIEPLKLGKLLTLIIWIYVNAFVYVLFTHYSRPYNHKWTFTLYHQSDLQNFS